MPCDERQRVTRMLKSERHEVPKRFPLVELCMTTADSLSFDSIARPARTASFLMLDVST